MSLLWTGRDASPNPQPDDLGDVLRFMAWIAVAALAMVLLALF